MFSALTEIEKLRGNHPIIIDYYNKNRYLLISQEGDGSKTAYYFSTPIYNQNTRRMINLNFCSDEKFIYATGSNANIRLSNKLLMENNEISCFMELPQQSRWNSSQEVYCGSCVLSPTTNGVAMRCNIAEGRAHGFILNVGKSHLNVRANDRSFALMKEEFKPLIVLSCIGSLDAWGNILAPARMEYQKLTDKKYCFSISATTPLATAVLFEVNLYENKLFQDTTVESNNASANNVFGSVGFIGESCLYGEQWLYSRPDCAILSELKDKRIRKAILHIRKLNQSNVEICSFKTKSRFCSFGSTWNNKIPYGTPVAESVTQNGYHSLDITSLVANPRTNTMIPSDGLILKSKTKDSGFTAIATGDSCYAPQILEINYQ